MSETGARVRRRTGDSRHEERREQRDEPGKSQAHPASRPPVGAGNVMDVVRMQPPLLPPFRGSDHKRALAKP